MTSTAHDRHHIATAMDSRRDGASRGAANLINNDVSALKEYQKLEASGQPLESHIQIMDRIHARENIKLAQKIAELREAIARGVSLKEKTYHEQLIEELEERVTQNFKYQQFKQTQDQVAEVRNVTAKYVVAEANREKLMGNFDLRLNKNLSMPQKIIKYAHEPVVFYLHKNRNYLKKIQSQVDDEAKRKEERAKETQMIEENQKLVDNSTSQVLASQRKRNSKMVPYSVSNAISVEEYGESLLDTTIQRVDSIEKYQETVNSVEEYNKHKLTQVQSQPYLQSKLKNPIMEINNEIQQNSKDIYIDGSSDDNQDPPEVTGMPKADLNLNQRSVEHIPSSPFREQGIQQVPPSQFRSIDGSKHSPSYLGTESGRTENGRYKKGSRSRNKNISIIQSGQSMIDYNRMILQQMNDEQYQDEHEYSSRRHRSRADPESSRSKIGSLASRTSAPKYQNRKRDYYRFNVLFNRLAQHSQNHKSRTLSVQDYANTLQRQNQYESANDIILSARQQIKENGQFHITTEESIQPISTADRYEQKRNVRFVNQQQQLPMISERGIFSKRIQGSKSVRHSKTKAGSYFQSPIREVMKFAEESNRRNSATFVMKPPSPKMEPAPDREKAEVRSQISSIIQNCVDSAKDVRSGSKQFNQSLKEINMKQENFYKVLGIINEVDVDSAGMIESTFNYKLGIRDEEKANEQKAVREYHNGTLTQVLDNSKYHRKQAQKKQKEERLRKKKEAKIVDIGLNY